MILRGLNSNLTAKGTGVYFKARPVVQQRFLISLASILFFQISHPAFSAQNTVEYTKKSAETQVKRLLEPILDKYCHDECKLMSVKVSVDVAVPDQLTPGFDGVEITKTRDLEPTSAEAKLLINDRVGPVSRGKLLDLLQQYLETLEYPVRIDTQITHFPMPQGSEGKVSELRSRVVKDFLGVADDLIRKFCSQRCILADFNLDTEVVNGEEAQYGSTGEFIQEGDTAIRIKQISATLLMDESLSPDEQANILEMLRLKTNRFKHADIKGKSMAFPNPEMGGASASGPAKWTRDAQGNLIRTTNTSTSKDVSKSALTSKNNSTSKSNNSTRSSESASKNENYSRVERIERVESGDAVQKELQKFKVFGIIFGASIFALLIFIAVTSFRASASAGSAASHPSTVRMIGDLASDSGSRSGEAASSSGRSSSDRAGTLAKRYEIERIFEDLVSVFSQQPRVAKQVFTKILTEEGVEVTAECIHLFGEGIVVDLLRDPSLQSDLNELMDYYAKNPIDLNDDQKLDLLKKLQARTVAGKLVVTGSRSSNLFDFLGEMDGLQILELIRTESLTVKAIALTQVDHQKRSAIYSQMDPETRMSLLSELSRIDYLPRDYIFNVANALKRKRHENPKLNTEALPGSDVLVGLLEKTGLNLQKTIVKNLEITNPDSARTVKGKLVSLDTLKYLRDGQLLEVILSLKHEELIQFLKGASADIRKVIYSKSPRELVTELEEEVELTSLQSRETYSTVERKILNRMKVLAGEGHINLVETNERMFAESVVSTAPTGRPGKTQTGTQGIPIKKVGGW